MAKHDRRKTSGQPPSSRPVTIAGRAVAEYQPDDLRGRTVQGGTTAEVPVLRHDREAVPPRVLPDGRVVCRR